MNFTRKEGEELKNKILNLELEFNNLERKFLVEHNRIIDNEEQSINRDNILIALKKENIKHNENIKTLDERINILKSRI
jgi:hypothetical protein